MSPGCGPPTSAATVPGELRNPARGTLLTLVIGPRSRRCLAGRFSTVSRIGGRSRTADPTVCRIGPWRVFVIIGSLLVACSSADCSSKPSSSGPGDLLQPDRQPAPRGLRPARPASSIRSPITDRPRRTPRRSPTCLRQIVPSVATGAASSLNAGSTLVWAAGLFRSAKRSGTPTASAAGSTNRTCASPDGSAALGELSSSQSWAAVPCRYLGRKATDC
jgi:hypothetical protein